MSHKSTSLISQAQAIRDAIALAMEKDNKVFLTGEGVTDPRGIFGTTLDLVERFGKERVFDAPLSENCMAGVCIGSALAGMKPILVFSRIEFALLAMDQLVNNAARWSSLFGAGHTIPLVVRIIFGRGYGIDPNHSRDLQSILAQIPGLKTVVPTSAVDAKGLLLAAIEDTNPVVFLEHRYLHDSIDDVADAYYTLPLHDTEVVAEGRDVSVAAYSYSVFAAAKAAEVLKRHGIELEVFNMRSANPVNVERLSESVKKTGRLIVADTNIHFHGIAAQIVTKVIEQCFLYLSCAPLIIDASEDKVDPLFGTQITNEAISIAQAAVKLTHADQSNKVNMAHVIQEIRNDVEVMNN